MANHPCRLARPRQATRQPYAAIVWWACAVGFLITIICALPMSSQTKAEKRMDMGIGVELAYGLAQYHDTCVEFRAFFVSGEFFSGLHKVNTPGGVEFRKGVETYRTFPDHFVVDLQATPYKCSSAIATPPSPDFASGLLKNLSFDVNWKTGSNTRPASALPTHVQHRVATIRWDYLIEIPAKYVPLTDQLVIDVSARNNISLCRVTSSLK
jgi:hypothetical protein